MSCVFVFYTAHCCYHLIHLTFNYLRNCNLLIPAARVPRAPIKALVNTSSQRYFRIPFVRGGGANSSAGGNDSTAGSKRGWWYAHFDGQYVARQMELHPDKPAILLVAGKQFTSLA
jgi:myosin-6